MWEKIIVGILFRVLNFRHWYQVKFYYLNGDKEIFYTIMRIGLVRKSMIINPRIVNGLYHDVILDDHHKRFLCNGRIGYQVMSYLGHFRQGN